GQSNIKDKIESPFLFTDNNKIYLLTSDSIFDQQGYKNNWDGKYQKSKKPLPAGPYYYIVQLNDGSAPRSGWLYITY
ncbi:gliding motility-associated C-terminal domain-containing protein, partial [Flavobacteriaceae bacterium]|nr:gliding motility-associated C-terminal domain-containing protein [Flavobacteriaceae bacterium]